MYVGLCDMQPLSQLKTLSIAYPDSVFVAVFIQNSMRMRCIICGLPTLYYFSALVYKRHGFLTL